MDQEEKKLKIDVAGIISAKNPRLIKVIPRFLITLLKKLIHQDEINVILEKHGRLKGRDFAKATLEHLNIRYKVHGSDSLDSSKRYIFVSNHPLGGLDGMILIEIFGEVFKNVRFVVNDLLMSIEPLRPIFIPVNKYGRQNVDNAKLIHDSYSSAGQILYFPAGLCSRLVKGTIADLDWKKSFVNQAIKYGRDIVPIFFEGKNSGFFYKFANFRKSLGIKFNYETILLPHEMFRQKGATFNIYIGEPIPHEQLAGGGNAAYWTQKIREEVYNLKEQQWNR
ncbi:MAG: glycerol acyltransferase [Bacteroidetes bacterium HGW-Bacteroidetes-10]|jgi:putative hemolysin|nr:MAG: glycerol acyltransferase [Bacteroidetes bacterium HGW-Bacteroidetes-10]